MKTLSQTCSLLTKLYCFFSKSQIWYAFSCIYTYAAKHVKTKKGKKGKTTVVIKFGHLKQQACVKILIIKLYRKVMS